MATIGWWMVLAVSALVTNEGVGPSSLTKAAQPDGGAQVEKAGLSPDKAKDRTYASAFGEAQATNRPMVVIVTATWCAPCQVLKKQVLTPLEAEKGFQNVVLAYVNMDKEPALAKQLVGNQGIPQVIVFEKNSQKKWVRRNLTGYQELATVRDFIRPRHSNDSNALRLADQEIGSVVR